MRRWVVALVVAMSGGAVWAQDAVWVQIEAQPTLGQAQEAARDYAAELADVAGFALNNGWYVIALGPYADDDAQTVLRRLRAQTLIPADSYTTEGDDYRQQFWPVGTGAATTPQPLPEETAPVAGVIDLPGPSDAAPAEIVVTDPVAIVVPDETEREARASEQLLSQPQRELLQIGLAWAGFYTSSIDGAFGPGTRGAMADWQAANGYEVTGILTSRQRAALLAAYNAPLDGMDLQLVRDDAAGIEMLIPTGVVAFSDYDPPFARYDATGEIGAQVLLISQSGDLNRLFGLYEIMQTLQIVPPEGPRARGDRSFELEGIGPEIHSYTYAALDDGEIKGFSLIWPAGDEERRARVLAEMRTSFTRLPGVLDPALARPGEDQAVDLISGLQVRQPRLSRSGFFVTAEGVVLTTTEAVGDCTEITIDGTHPADILLADDSLGIAFLTPQERLAPLGIAAFQTAVPRLQSEVAVAGYPYGGVLTRPAMTFGRLADLRGLNGEADVKRLAIVAQPGDAGGPVFDNAGAVMGMLQPKIAMNGQILPDEVSFATNVDAILTTARAAGLVLTTTDSAAFVPPETITRQAAGMTVLVSCW